MSASSESDDKIWFVLTKNGQRGPDSTTSLHRFAWQGHIHRSSQVRRHDGSWFDAGEVEHLWDVRWKLPNGELMTDGHAAAPQPDGSTIAVGWNRILPLLSAVKAWLGKSSPTRS